MTRVSTGNCSIDTTAVRNIEIWGARRSFICQFDSVGMSRDWSRLSRLQVCRYISRVWRPDPYKRVLVDQAFRWIVIFKSYWTPPNLCPHYVARNKRAGPVGRNQSRRGYTVSQIHRSKIFEIDNREQDYCLDSASIAKKAFHIPFIATTETGIQLISLLEWSTALPPCWRQEYLRGFIMSLGDDHT